MASKTRNITTESLGKYLGLIGWRLRHMGCDHYQIYNDYGNQTQFWYHRGEISLGESKQAFGRDGKDYGKNGFARFPTAALIMEYDDGEKIGCYPSVSFLFRGFTKGISQTYISFYGVKMSEKKDKENEKA